MSKIIDLKGKRFGMLEVVDFFESKNGHALWVCLCDCGKTKIVRSDALRRQEVQSCGCKQTTSDKGKISTSKYQIDGTITYLISDKIRANNSSGRRGVFFDKHIKKWRAVLTISGKRRYFGSYENYEDAVKAREAAEEKYLSLFWISITPTTRAGGSLAGDRGGGE